MECKLQYGYETIGEKLFSGTIEKPIDLDFTLPDYCADIQKILKCNIKPIIMAKSVSGEKLEMEGIVSVRVFYLDSIGKELRFCEKAIPFSVNTSLKRAALSPIIIADIKTQYINCRAVSSRRLDIHGAFSINASVYDNGKFEFVKRIDEDTVEQKEQNITLSELCVAATHQFMLSNTLETGSSKPVVENIIRSSEQVRIDDIRNVSGTMIIRGNLIVSILYSSGIENMNLEKIEYEIPFNESVETSCNENNAIIKVNAQVCDVEIKVKSDNVGENSIISLDAKIVCEILAYKDKEITALSDAFSREYETNIEFKPVNISHIKEHIHKNEQTVSNLKIENGDIDKIIDIWNENCSIKYEDENLLAKYNVCLLYRNKEEKICYIEKTLDFTYPISTKEKTEARGKVLNIEAKVKSPEDIEIKTDIEMDYDILSENVYKILSKLFEDEDSKKNKPNNSLCIYFASEGESVWEIAKEHLCSINDIKTENMLIEDYIKEAQTLIISI